MISRLGMRIAIAFGLALVCAPTSAVIRKAEAGTTVPRPGKLHVFGDWIAGCDNSGDCAATSVLPQADDFDDDFLSMSVNRTAAGKVVIELNARQYDGDADLMIVGARHFALNNDAQLDPTQADSQLKNGDTDAFFRLRFEGKPITVIDRRGKRLGAISSKGLEQAIAYIEQVQQAFGRNPPTVPVIRSGFEPGARPLPVSQSQIRRLSRELHRHYSECDWQGPDLARIKPLDRRHTLVLLICWGGTKNSSEAVYIAGRTRHGIALEPAKFDDSEYSSAEPDFLDNPEVEEGGLFERVGGNGASDPHSYGIVHDYQWDGTRFRLTSVTEASSLSHGYHDEISTWRAEVVPR